MQENKIIGHNIYSRSQGKDLKFVEFIPLQEMRPTLIQRIRHWLKPNPFKKWKWVQDTETYISDEVKNEKFW